MNNVPNNETQKRHCMVVHAHYPMAETRVQREAEALLAHGFQVDVICLLWPGEAAFEVVRGINVYRLPIHTVSKEQSLISQLLEYLHFFVLAAFKLTRLHLKKRYNVIQVHNLPDFLVFCALLPKLGGTPIILDIHDVIPEFLAARTGRSLDSWLVRLAAWQEQLSCGFADHVITVTEPWRQVLVKRGVPQEKTSVVMNMADSQLFHPGVRQQVIEQRDRNTFHLIYHGVQTYRHGLDILLRAVAQVWDQIPELYLTLHGEGAYRGELERLVGELGLTDCVHFTKRYVPVSELPALIANADVGVIPYRTDIFTDGILPTKLMEYVSLGIPVIASRTSAIEAYFDETTIEFFAPGNVDDLARCLLKLHTDRNRREQLVQNGTKFREQYKWGKISTEYASLVVRLSEKK
ncbi:MAG: glycosyltransferase family 4 protein [Anaerolineae bacterium]|nr:glycosyltransferase family 4 protein [Anaerolineae bacterium]